MLSANQNLFFTKQRFGQNQNQPCKINFPWNRSNLLVARFTQVGHKFSIKPLSLVIGGESCIFERRNRLSENSEGQVQVSRRLLCFPQLLLAIQPLDVFHFHAICSHTPIYSSWLIYQSSRTRFLLFRKKNC